MLALPLSETTLPRRQTQRFDLVTIRCLSEMRYQMTFNMLKLCSNEPQQRRHNNFVFHHRRQEHTVQYENAQTENNEAMFHACRHTVDLRHVKEANLNHGRIKCGKNRARQHRLVTSI